MACVTLKRTLELDSLMSPESQLKRRRTSVNAGHCAPFRPTFSNSPPHHHYPQQQQQPTQNSNFQQQTSSAAGASAGLISTGPKISSDELESYLLSEIPSLRTRRRLVPNRQLADHTTEAAYFGRSSPSSNGGNSDSESEQNMDSGVASSFHAQEQQSSAAAQSDRPLFTYKQVRMICERLLKEQETRLREEYDQVMNARLSEQYDTFVRFTYDQIHRRIDDSPMTYLS